MIDVNGFSIFTRFESVKDLILEESLEDLFDKYVTLVPAENDSVSGERMGVSGQYFGSLKRKRAAGKALPAMQSATVSKLRTAVALLDDTPEGRAYRQGVTDALEHLEGSMSAVREALAPTRPDAPSERSAAAHARLQRGGPDKGRKAG